MMLPLDVIDTGEASARWNVAATAALTELHDSGRIPDTLRFHRYPRSVLLGRHQLLSGAVHENYCEADGVEIARRITGGGAVYMEPGALAWDLVIDRRRAGGAGTDASARIGAAVASALSRLGLAARYRADNEVEIDGRKLCGTSGFSWGETAICQGTIMVDTDLSDMQRYLRLPSPGTVSAEGDVRRRHATVSEVLGGSPALGELEAVIGTALAREFGFDPVDRTLSAEGRALADELHEREYGRDDFVRTELPSAGRDTIVGRDGAVVAYIKVHQGEDRRIEQIWLTGSIAASPARAILDLEASLRGVPISAASGLAAKFLSRRSIRVQGAARDAIPVAIGNAR